MALHRELHERDYPYARPGIETEPWGLEVTVLDPFANRIVLHQPTSEDAPVEGPVIGAVEGGGTAAGPIEHEYVVRCAPPTTRSTSSPRGSRSGGTHGLRAARAHRRRVGERRSRPDVLHAGRGRVDLPVGHDEPTWERCHFAMDFTLAQDHDHPSRIDVPVRPRPGG